MAITKKEENLTFCYKDFCISANGPALKMLVGVAFTLVIIAGLVSLTEKR